MSSIQKQPGSGGSHLASRITQSHSDTHIVPDFTDHYIMLHINLFHQCLAAQIMTLLLMPLRHLPMSVPRATCPGEFTMSSVLWSICTYIFKILTNTEYLRCTVLLSSCRETETFESVAEDDQLPQVVEELHDVHVSPGSPIAKMQLKVKGKFINQY